MSRLAEQIRNTFSLIKKRLFASLRLEMLGTFVICVLISMIVFYASSVVVSNFTKQFYFSFSSGITALDNEVEAIKKELEKQKINLNDKEKIAELFAAHQKRHKNNKIYLTDLQGNILYKTKNGRETKIDIYYVIRSMRSYKDYQYYDFQNSQDFQYTTLLPVAVGEDSRFVVLEGLPEGTVIYWNKLEYYFPIPLLMSVATFLILFYILTRRKVQYIEELSNGLLHISRGNLNYRVVKKGEDELSSLAENINYMSRSLKKKIAEERIAEKTKNELITNVSHDLRTPLTSIIGYLGLIKEEKYENQAEYNKYLHIVYNKAEKLRCLIEDLFEFTKLNYSGVDLNLQTIVLADLLAQLCEELTPLFKEEEVILEKEFSNDNIVVKVDPVKIVRAFENLMTNAIRYSCKPGKVMISLKKVDNGAIVVVQNRSKDIPREDLVKIFERFYRVDKSRSEKTGGSGLGLAITKSIIEQHQGSIWAECENNLVKFYVKLCTNK